MPHGNDIRTPRARRARIYQTERAAAEKVLHTMARMHGVAEDKIIIREVAGPQRYVRQYPRLYVFVDGGRSTINEFSPIRGTVEKRQKLGRLSL